MTRRLFSLLLVLLACAGCGENWHAWQPPPDATEEERAVIRDAFDEWCVVGWECDTLEANGASKISFHAPWKPGGAGGAQVWWEFNDTGDRWDARIWVAPDRTNPTWLPTLRRYVLHELGHWHKDNLGHLPRGNVMGACDNAEMEHLTDADMAGGYYLPAEWAETHGCGE